MPLSIALFNHKGGVGKTTLTVNLARAFHQLKKRVLVVDADPQCNATAFYLSEAEVDKLLDESVNPEEGGTLWSGIALYVRGRGDTRAVQPFEIDDNVMLLPGDVLLGSFEDRLSTAWKDSFSRDATSIDLMSAVYRCVKQTAETYEADVVLYDVGPSVGSLNRAILLGCDYFIIPVGCDLFSLRALRAVGQTLRSWMNDWDTVRKLSKELDDITLLPGQPAFVGYLTQHFNIYRGRSTIAFEEWEKRIAPRIIRDVIGPIGEIDQKLVPKGSPLKLGQVPAFHSLAPLSQKHGVPIGGLRGCADVNHGWYPKIDEADELFIGIAREIAARVGLDGKKR